MPKTNPEVLILMPMKLLTKFFLEGKGGIKTTIWNGLDGPNR
jgi:hypothetical protein